MQDFTNYFGSINAADARYRIEYGVSLNGDLRAKVAQLVGHLSGHTISSCHGMLVCASDGLFFGELRVHRRIHLEFPSSYELQLVGRPLGYAFWPLANRALADTDRLGNRL